MSVLILRYYKSLSYMKTKKHNRLGKAFRKLKLRLNRRRLKQFIRSRVNSLSKRLSYAQFPQ